MQQKEWAIGIDIGGTKIEIALVDKTGTLLKQVRFPTNISKSPEAIQKEIHESIKQLCAELSIQPIGIGIGMAGQITPLTGIVQFAPNLKWKNVPLQEQVAKLTGLPTIVTNDVRAATWSEWLFGAGKNCSNLVCLFVGTGIGGGVVLSKQMLEGINNCAGELGHMVIDLNGPKCSCGSKGCLEAWAGGWAIAKRAQERASKMLLELANGKRENITAKIVEQGYLKKDPVSVEIMKEALEALVAGGVSIVNALNPEKLILGGGVLNGMPEWVSQIENGIKQRALKSAVDILEVLPAQLGENSVAVGAATYAFYKLLKTSLFLEN